MQCYAASRLLDSWLIRTTGNEAGSRLSLCMHTDNPSAAFASPARCMLTRLRVALACC